MSLGAELRRAGWMKLIRVGSSGTMRRTRIVSVGSKLLLAANMDPDMELAAMWLPVDKDGELLLRIVPMDSLLGGAAESVEGEVKK